MKKLAFALSALAALTAGSAMAQGAANTADGTVEIRGKVVDQTCEVDTSYKNLVVILDTIGKNKLAAKGAVAAPKPFQIKLTGCSAADQSGVTHAFASFSTASISDVIDVNDQNKGVLVNKATDSNASGVGIQILNFDDSPINLNPVQTQTAVGTAGGATYSATDAEVTFGIIKNFTTKTEKRKAADANADANTILGKKVAGGETWIVGDETTNKGKALTAGNVELDYKAQYIATEDTVTAGNVEAFVSYNISYK